MESNKEFTLSVSETLDMHGIDILDAMVMAVDYGIAPACCTEGCEVEPDGHCEHGQPSVLIASYLI
jgi:hypothetical protein